MGMSPTSNGLFLLVRNIAIATIGLTTTTFAAHSLYHAFSLRDTTVASIPSNQTDKWNLSQWTIAGILTAIGIFTLRNWRQAIPPPPQRIAVQNLTTPEDIYLRYSRVHSDGKTALHDEATLKAALPDLRKLAADSVDKVFELLGKQSEIDQKTPLHNCKFDHDLVTFLDHIATDKPAELLRLFCIQDDRLDTCLNCRTHLECNFIPAAQLILKMANYDCLNELIKLFQISNSEGHTLLDHPSIFFKSIRILQVLIANGNPQIVRDAAELFIDTLEVAIKSNGIDSYNKLRDIDKKAFKDVRKRICKINLIDDQLKIRLNKILTQHPELKSIHSMERVNSPPPSLDAFKETINRLRHESIEVIDRELSKTYSDGKIALHHKELFFSAIPLLEKIARWYPETVCRLLSIQMPEYLKTPLHGDESYSALDKLFGLISEKNPSALIKLFSIQDVNKDTYISSHAKNFKIALPHLSLISADGNFAAELLAMFQIRMWRERIILFNPDIFFSSCPILLNLLEKGSPDVQIATVHLFVEALEFLIVKSIPRVKEATIHKYKQLLNKKDSQIHNTFCKIIKMIFNNQEIDDTEKKSFKRVLYDDPSFRALWPYTEVPFKVWPSEIPALPPAIPPLAQNLAD